MKQYILLLGVFLASYTTLSAQEKEIIQLDGELIETLFLANNLELIAERYNIDLAEAEIIQAKLWDNPSLSIEQVNLWSTKSQREGEKEVIPPLFGKFGRNTQFSIELSQLIQTANKRGKLIGRERVARDMASKEFEETLRNLKNELRMVANAIEFRQNYIVSLTKQQIALAKLVQSYQKQVDQGNIAKSQLIRLQASELELDTELYGEQSELNEQLSNLKTLLNIEPHYQLILADKELNLRNPDSLPLQDLFDKAIEARPDMELARLQTQYYNKALSYEKSLRVPDITFNASYDRAGGVWKDYIGFGFSIDLPFFNRNQGGIKAARISHEQSKMQYTAQQNKIRQEISKAWNNYVLAYDLYQKVSRNDLSAQLDTMLDVYTKNLLNRNISMLEYIDFVDAHKNNKQHLLSAKKEAIDWFIQLESIVSHQL